MGKKSFYAYQMDKLQNRLQMKTQKKKCISNQTKPLITSVF